MKMMVHVEVRPDFVSKTTEFGFSPYGNWKEIAINKKYSICQVFYIDPNLPSQVYYEESFPILEKDDGLAYFAYGNWKLFDNVVQQEYSDFTAEKELLK